MRGQRGHETGTDGAGVGNVTGGATRGGARGGTSGVDGGDTLLMGKNSVAK